MAILPGPPIQYHTIEYGSLSSSVLLVELTLLRLSFLPSSGRQSWNTMTNHENQVSSAAIPLLLADSFRCTRQKLSLSSRVRRWLEQKCLVLHQILTHEDFPRAFWTKPRGNYAWQIESEREFLRKFQWNKNSSRFWCRNNCSSLFQILPLLYFGYLLLCLCGQPHTFWAPLLCSHFSWNLTIKDWDWIDYFAYFIGRCSRKILISFLKNYSLRRKFLSYCQYRFFTV